MLNNNLQDEAAKYIRYRRSKDIVLDVFTIILIIAVIVLMFKVTKDIADLPMRM